ncbi:MAG: response regulator [Dysgonamonadaceae bacterium]|jgi:signal transduction histidine kinase/ligand-binding sensor domain-containing protein/CheY-like chemotaxis protein/AraC-like DNA-binding protein|nr:response regulator [Dysgonamonadaceae bacterium]
MKYAVWITSLLLMACLSVYPIKFKHISTHNGLSSKRTFSIEKDNKGFIWISTRLGIDRYDGKSIKQYVLANETGDRDMTGRINTLSKDKSGNIWVFTNYGRIFRYNKLSDSYSLILNLADSARFSNLFLNGIHFVDDDNMLVYGSFGVWLYRIDRQKLLCANGLKDKYVFTIEAMQDSTYAVSSDKGQFIVSMALGQDSIMEKFTHTIGFNERVQVMYYDAFNASLLLGSFTGKLLLYDVPSGQLKKLDFDFKESVRDVKCYNNTLYIATDGAGLITMNNDTKQLQETYTNAILKDFNVSSFAYYNVLYDDNRLWLATYSDGVYLFDENLPDFRTIHYRQQTEISPGNSLNTLMEDSDGNLWFGTNDGVYRYHVKNKTWVHLLKSNISANEPRYNVLTLCEDNNGLIWVGGTSFGRVSCIRKQSLAVTDNYYFNEKQEDVFNGRVYSIFKDSGGNIWMGGLHGLLTKYSPSDRQIKRYNVTFVNTITESNGIVLVGSAKGLYIQNKNNDSFTEVLTKDKTHSSLQSFINAIYEDKQGILWLGSEEGLLRYNKNTGELKTFTTSDGLLSNNIYGILSDTRNRIWLSAEQGLTCFDPQGGEFINFGMEEGLSDDRFRPRSAFYRKNGEMLFGTNNGAISFAPEKIDRLKINCRLILTGFMIDYRPVYPSQPHSPLEKDIDETSFIRLKHDQNTFSFGFTSINFTNPHRTKFEWMLEGYDKDWVKETDTNYAYYTNVPPGNYVFRLRSINTDNGKEPERKIIRINISRPWWATLWAQMFYILFVIALLWVIAQIIRGKIEKRNTSEKIRFFTHTAHELKTPVSLIKGPLHKIQENERLSDEGNIMLDLVVKNTDRLSNLVAQLLDFQKTEMSEVQLSMSEHTLSAYLKNHLQPFLELAAQKNIRLTFIFNAEHEKVWFDEDKMNKIINNLLSNACKYTPSGGEIRLSVSGDKNNWSLAVRDNGIGIPRKVQKEIFKPFYRANNAVNSTETGSGIGLLLTKNLVQMHRGSISFESEEGVGSVFSVTFPCGCNHHKKSKYLLTEKKKTDKADPVQRHNHHKPAVIVVEDNDELRLFLKQCLIDKYLVHEAINGHEGIRLTKIVFPELIISDVMMPEMDGYELCKQIKGSKETSHIPVILLTALDNKSDILKGYELGADNYVTKPFDATILKLTIENTIATRQALRKNLMLPLETDVHKDVELAVNPLDKAFLDEVTGIIDKNISDSEFSINDLCREVAMSRTSFYNKMKILTDQSPNSFIRLVRLNRAAKMLKEGVHSVTDIATSTGFGDVKYFSIAFKKHFGLSPSKYMGSRSREEKNGINH